MSYEDKIIKDNLGRIIYQERSDGFYENIEYYDNGNIKKIETHYPDGKIEIERYGSLTNK